MGSTITHLTLVLGGARSGKSAFAEAMVEGMGPKRVYLATARPGDAEMVERISLHKARRGDGWQTREAEGGLGRALAGGAPLLLDCLTLWLSALFETGDDPVLAADRLLDDIAGRAGPVVVVSNEIGMGLVPDTALGRSFRDAQGRLNQQFALRAGRVAFVAAGLPLWLKGGP